MNKKIILPVIQSFYDKAKKDFMIGYHFRFIEDFESHIPRIAAFWELQLTQTITDRSYLPFNLLKVHGGLGIKTAEIGRWIILFEQTLNEFLSQKELSEKDYEFWMEKVHFFKLKIEKHLGFKTSS